MRSGPTPGPVAESIGVGRGGWAAECRERSLRISSLRLAEASLAAFTALSKRRLTLSGRSFATSGSLSLTLRFVA